MLPSTQIFNKTDYEKFDNYKDFVIRSMISEGWDAWINEDTYGVDILATDGYGFISVDVEVKQYDWTSKSDFPFPTVHFTGRKEKFSEGNFIYLIISQNKKGAFFQKGSIIYSIGKPVVKTNRRENVIDKEVFYELSVDDVIFTSF